MILVVIERGRLIEIMLAVGFEHVRIHIGHPPHLVHIVHHKIGQSISEYVAPLLGLLRHLHMNSYALTSEVGYGQRLRIVDRREFRRQDLAEIAAFDSLGSEVYLIFSIRFQFLDRDRIIPVLAGCARSVGEDHGRIGHCRTSV